MTIKPKFIPVLLASAITIGCASNKILTETEAFQAYPALAQLSQQVVEANQNNLSILSPKAYAEATAAFTKAQKLATKGKDESQKVASEGLASMNIGLKNSEQARDIFEDILTQRSKTLAAYGNNQSKAFQEADAAFLKLTKKFENKEFDEAKAGRAEVIQKYAELELKAVKTNVLEDVKKELMLAKDADLDDITPKTFKLAQEELDLAISTLNINRNDTQKAEEHVQKALWHLNRAKQINEMIKNFKASDFSEEDKVLWYQKQLDKIALPLNKPDLYDQANKTVVNTLASAATDLNSKIISLSDDLSGAYDKLASTESSLKLEAEALREQSMKLKQEQEQQMAAIKREKDEQIEALRLAQEAEKQRQKAIANKFAEVQQLFDSTEAEVYRKADDVLIRAHGFTFKSGNSEIDSTNFALLNKIVQAISKFEKSNVIVSGHTDAVGSEEINMNLSQQRAEKVAQFLAQVGQISPQRIEHKGFGESRPVASNETDSGRASNRRVEILIKNSSPTLIQ